MSHATSVTFTCDKCGLGVTRPADTRIAEEELPPGWSSMSLESAEEPDERFELCADCRAFIAKGFQSGPSGRIGIVVRHLPSRLDA